MGIIQRLKYFTQRPEFKVVRPRNSTAVVVFIHGILSNSEVAFKSKSGDSLFWNELKEAEAFQYADIAYFTYGWTDFRYLLEIESPFNNLQRLSSELHGCLRPYSTVILVGHSQGGLLAKVYACRFHREQGIFLTTLHTPHRGESIGVMKLPGIDEWTNNVSYQVPHLFAGSVHDLVVKPDQALHGCNEVVFTSFAQDGRGDGHSHLNSNPDPKFLAELQKHSHYFLQSGFSQQFPVGSNAALAHERTLDVVFSRSARKLEKNGKGSVTTISQPWVTAEFDEPNTLSWTKFDGDVVIEFHGSSVNYLRRHSDFVGISTGRRTNVVCLDITDPFGFDELDLMIGEDVFEPLNVGPNPYSSLGVDINAFPKRSLIYNEDFAALLLELTSRSGLRLGAENYDEKLNLLYIRAIHQYRTALVKRVHRDALAAASSVGVHQFSKIIDKIVYTTKKLPEKTNEYREVYELIKRALLSFSVKVNIKLIECIISNLFRSDGYSYRLDRDVVSLFRNDDDIKYRTG